MTRVDDLLIIGIHGLPFDVDTDPQQELTPIRSQILHSFRDPQPYYEQYNRPQEFLAISSLKKRNGRTFLGLRRADFIQKLSANFNGWLCDLLDQPKYQEKKLFFVACQI